MLFPELEFPEPLLPVLFPEEEFPLITTAFVETTRTTSSDSLSRLSFDLTEIV